VASAIDDDHFLAFSCDKQGFSRPCRLGRVPLDAVQDRSAWTFWDGDNWNPAMDEAKSLFEGAPIMSLGWNDHLDAWLVVYAPSFSGKIVARTAPVLTGPWSREALVYDLPGDEAPYDANHHPELAEDDGTTEYITRSRHTTGWFGSEFPILRVELD
jgi:hypothetical protein